MNLITFVTASLLIILMPGTGVIYTVSTGLMKGKWPGVLAALGCSVGIIPHLLVSVLLSSFLAELGETVFSVVRIFGVLYLAYMGLGMICAKEPVLFGQMGDENEKNKILLRGIFINLLNPKLTLFFFSFLPQYASKNSQNYIMESFFWGFLFMLLTFLVFAVYGILAGSMKAVIEKNPLRIHRIQQIAGVFFLFFAGKLI